MASYYSITKKEKKTKNNMAKLRDIFFIQQVVGAGRGVGREIAIQLSQLGVTVACIDISEDMCNKTANYAARQHGNSKAYTCDVTVKKQVENTVKKIKNDLGEITMVIHCCGVPSPRVIIQEPPEIQKAMELSVISHFWVCFLLKIKNIFKI